MAKKRLMQIELERDDMRLLDVIARHLGVPRVWVLRWALRHYAACGPWPVGANGMREQVLGSGTVLVVGPSRMEVMP